MGRNSIVINSQIYDRGEFRRTLEANMKAVRADRASAYNDPRHPGHMSAVQEMQLGYRYLNGELSPENEREIVGEWNSAVTAAEETKVSNEQPFQEMAQIVSTAEGRIALQRARLGQSLDANQRALVDRHNELEMRNNAIARKEQASKGGWSKTTRPHMIPSELHAIERITDVRERTHAIRQQRAAWRDDPQSPYNNTRHPEHKNYADAMTRLYQEEERLGAQPEDTE
jgi:hypothetical protein